MKRKVLCVISLLVLLSLLMTPIPAGAVQGPVTDGPTPAAPGVSGRVIVQLEDPPLAVYWS